MSQPPHHPRRRVGFLLYALFTTVATASLVTASVVMIGLSAAGDLPSPEGGVGISVLLAVFLLAAVAFGGLAGGAWIIVARSFSPAYDGEALAGLPGDPAILPRRITTGARVARFVFFAGLLPVPLFVMLVLAVGFTVGYAAPFSPRLAAYAPATLSFLTVFAAGNLALRWHGRGLRAGLAPSEGTATE